MRVEGDVRSAIPLLVFVSLTVPAVAQDAGINVDRLPVNIERIKGQLKAVTFREEREGLNLKYYLNIYGQAPQLTIVAPSGKGSWANGPVPYGAPTHHDFI